MGACLAEASARQALMPLYSADALILRTYKLGEADRIVVFLTRDRGKKRGVAKGARRPKSNFVGALEPLTHARVAYFEKERRELVNLNYSEASRSALSSGTIEGLGCATYFAELIDEWAAESHEDERLVSARRLDGRSDCGRGADRAADAVFRVLAAQPAGCVSGGPRARACRPKRRRFWRRRERRVRRTWAAWPPIARCCASWRRCIAASSRRISSASRDRSKC